MEWRDEGIILNSRKHGEFDAILEVLNPRSWPSCRHC